jgi:hypothetical protein
MSTFTAATRYQALLATRNFVELNKARRGDRVLLAELTGDRLHQERPMDDRSDGKDAQTGDVTWGGTSGACDGETVDQPGTVSQVVSWADNSVEQAIECDDGQQRRYQIEPPSGDRCFSQSPAHRVRRQP